MMMLTCRNLPRLSHLAAVTVPCSVLMTPVDLLVAREGLRRTRLKAFMALSLPCLLWGRAVRYVLGF